MKHSHPSKACAAHLILLPIGLAALLVSCASESGSAVLTVHGEEFIEEGIPEEEVADGWAVEFSRFEVTISGVTVGGVTLEDASTLDLTAPSAGEGQELGTLEVLVGAHANSSFVIDRVEVDGSAKRSGEEKSFSWTFDGPVAYDECMTTTEITSGEASTFQITVHADHLFYDSLVAEEPELRFQALADADADADGDITQEELAEADLGAYDAGSAGEIDDLWAFLQAQVATLGHVDGEGHCHATPLG